MTKVNRITEVLVETTIGPYHFRIWFDEKNPVKVWTLKVLKKELRCIIGVAVCLRDIAELVANISGVNAVQVGRKGISMSYVVHNNRS